MPDVLYLNACQTGSGLSTSDVVTQLGNEIPALILNRTHAYMVEARDQARLFLKHLVNRSSPHLAITRAYQSNIAGVSSTAWMTPMLVQHYAKWIAPTTDELHFDDPNWRLKLDRKPQFSEVLYEVSTMLQQRHPLTLACFWHGVKGQGVDKFHERLPVELRDLNQGLRLETVSFQWPSSFTNPHHDFETMIGRELGVTDVTSLVTQLEARYLDSSQAPLLLHCRFATLRQQGAVKLQHIADFIDWWQLMILPQLENSSIHVLLAFGYELGEAADVKKFVIGRDRVLKKSALKEGMKWLKLDQLPSIEEHHVMEFLDRYKVRLPDKNGSMAALVSNIVAKTKGDYERTLDALQTIVPQAWIASQQNGQVDPKLDNEDEAF